MNKIEDMRMAKQSMKVQASTRTDAVCVLWVGTPLMSGENGSKAGKAAHRMGRDRATPAPARLGGLDTQVSYINCTLHTDFTHVGPPKKNFLRTIL